MWAGRSEEVKGKIIEGITRVFTENLGIPAEAVTVVIHDIPRENWGMAGKQASRIKI